MWGHCELIRPGLPQGFPRHSPGLTPPQGSPGLPPPELAQGSPRHSPGRPKDLDLCKNCDLCIKVFMFLLVLSRFLFFTIKTKSTTRVVICSSGLPPPDLAQGSPRASPDTPLGAPRTLIFEKNRVFVFVVFSRFFGF